MKINFTKKQYAKLLRMSYIANWVINAHELPDDGNADYNELNAHIMSFAKDFGMKEMVGIDDHGTYPTQLFEEDKETRGFLEEYSKRNFWEELVEHLSLRDFHKHYSEKEIKEMNSEERMKNFYHFAEKYEDEVRKHGTDRIKIDKNM